MELDEKTLQGLYQAKILNKADLKKINIINCFEQTGSAPIAARRNGVTRQYVWKLINKWQPNGLRGKKIDDEDQ